MAENSASGTVTIKASPEAVWAVILDFAAVPSWADQIDAVTVLTTDDEGRPTSAEYKVDAGPVKSTYTLEYAYTASTQSWKLVKGDVVKKNEGSYTVVADGAGSKVTYALTIGLTIPVPGFLRKKAEKSILASALDGLKKRVEG